VPQHPNPDVLSANVIQEMIRETVQITATKPASVKMEIPGIFDRFPDADLKLGKEILSKLMRNAIVLAQNFVQVRLNLSVEPSFHGGEALQPIRRK